MIARPPTIVVVDNDPAILDVLDEILREEGYDVITAKDANGLSSLAETVHPGLILLDCRLPGIQGETAAEKIKTSRTTKKIPVVLMSSSENLPVLAEQAQANDYLQKPFDVYDLLKLVQHHTPAKA